MSDKTKDLMLVRVTLKNNSEPLVFTNVTKFDWSTDGNRVTKLAWAFDDPHQILGFVDLDQIAAITYEAMPSYVPTEF